MRYIPNTDADCRQMLDAIGVRSVEDLFADIPAAVRLKRPLRIPPALSEADLAKVVGGLAAENADASQYSSFLGAGSYNHFSPAIIGHLISRGEFLTAYTPYQPEISQGTLQTMYEYQTLICQLTGMEVSNASMYEGASATAEAILMAHRVTGRNDVVVARSVHPEYRQVTHTYARQINLSFKEVPFTPAGTADVKQAKNLLSDKAACLVVQNPNFFGAVEDLTELAQAAHSVGALLVVAVPEPVSLGILKPPGECGADIVAGEGQALGVPMSYGGPYLGFFATQEKYMRQMPGRLVGATEDREGRTGYVLTLATREQHIRREKATSNICTSEALIATIATIYMETLGKNGLKEVALQNLRKASYAKDKLAKAKGCGVRFSGPTFNEFVVQVKKKPADILKGLLKKQIIGGLDLGGFYPELKDCLLVCVTEQNSREEIDALAKAMGGGR
ncbi:MAG: aminomethyl-transferring glycine dehydrogenase subunit GcvPA [Candidatus Methylomirabilota bacterium]